MQSEPLFFVVYVTQQLGVMLGLGAQTLLLCAHLVVLHRHLPTGKVGERDALGNSFTRATHLALGFGLALIATSGLGAVALHYAAGSIEVLTAPAFLFKWVLIGLAAAAFVAQTHVARWHETIAWFGGGSWYALFLVHSLAPVTTWANLVLLFGAWMLFFAAVWSGFVLILRGAHFKIPAIQIPPVKFSIPKMAKTIVPEEGLRSATGTRTEQFSSKKIAYPEPVAIVEAPKPSPPAPKPVAIEAPAPTLSLPKPPPPPPKPTPPPPVVPKKEHSYISWLPALRIMPQKPEDLGNHERGPAVNL